MYIRHILIVIVLFFVGKVQAQDSIRVGGALMGNWNITKVVAKTYSQQDKRLLQEKVLTSVEAIRTIRGFVPTGIVFQGNDCRIQHSYGVETGVYMTDNNGHLWYRRKENERLSPEVIMAGLPWTYNMEAGKLLVLEMPPSYYSEGSSNISVKLIYTCYYERAN